MASLQSCPLAFVEWTDSTRTVHEWKYVDAAELRPKLTTCYSIGWLISETDDVVSLLPHIGGDITTEMDGNIQGCGHMIIPKTAIIRMRQIRTPFYKHQEVSVKSDTENYSDAATEFNVNHGH